MAAPNIEVNLYVLPRTDDYSFSFVNVVTSVLPQQYHFKITHDSCLFPSKNIKYIVASSLAKSAC